MASIEDVRGSIQQAIEKANQSVSALQQAADLADDAQDLLRAATQGSNQSEVEQVNARFAEVASAVADLQKSLLAGISQAEGIDSRL
ncbi:hypothetical protein [Saccharothrix syringae]|uniref:Methyl-accepting chemotaxis protein n=1 Tax=Saccharothrix syringae TaxID=103733 RepID=A0A5Q0GT54_SACSY|nr:hypothetical protein [Saccharothrix syringae]QFZ16542.1 hypothetical protein EKG83_02830 [Saccharothrix syringae]